MKEEDIKRLIGSNIRASEQRGVKELNADFPFLFAQKGVFTTLCSELKRLIDERNVDMVVGIESLGFPLAGAMAYALNAELVLMRKEGSLPGDVVESKAFTVPYKKRVTKLEIQKDIIFESKDVILVDEAIDTGITLDHAIELLKNRSPKSLTVFTFTNYPDLREIRGVKVESLIYGQF